MVLKRDCKGLDRSKKPKRRRTCVGIAAGLPPPHVVTSVVYAPGPLSARHQHHLRPSPATSPLPPHPLLSVSVPALPLLLEKQPLSHDLRPCMRPFGGTSSLLSFIPLHAKANLWNAAATLVPTNFEAFVCA